MALIFGGAGTLAAQMAARLRRPALERRAMAASGAWQTGVGMAAITHLLFGVLFIACMALWIGREKTIGDGRFSDLVIQAFFFVMASLLAVGWARFPATAFLAHRIAALRRKELTSDAA